MAGMHAQIQHHLSLRFTSTRECFRAFQNTKAGVIDIQDFESGARKFFTHGVFDVRAAHALFRMIDEDHDGFVTYQDFCKWIKQPDMQTNLLVKREDPFPGQVSGMSFKQRCAWISARVGSLCE